MLGTLDAFQGEARPLAFHATLFPYPVMCPACAVGEVSGTLDDGIGVGPDYLVHGGYGGDLGSGAFGLVVRLPGGALVGSMRGRFQDASFAARYTLRR